MPANSRPPDAPRAEWPGQRRGRWLGALILATATGIVYANTFRGPFIFDDVSSIVDNPTIRRLWPPGDALSPPSGWGHTVSGRPILNLSFAVNYAISGPDVWSYHALNLVIHMLAGLALFGCVRRTLRSPRCRSLLAGDSEANAPASRLLQSDTRALVIAMLWLVHPLQTESVTYVVQRAESLMGLFLLLTLYAFARAADARHPHPWWVLSFVACLLGVGTKEVAAMAPVLVVLYDRTFVSGSFRAAWRRHRWIHLALAATWLPLAWLLAGTGGNRGGTVGFDVGVSWAGYWLTQFEAITRYLALTFWPHPLIFDYGKVISADFFAALAWAVPVVALASATLIALRRRPVAGFLGAWFFVILAPTSIVPGANQMIVEHRMYLPLAAVIVFCVARVAPLLDRRVFLAGTGVLGLLAGGMTMQRNANYADEQRLWEITVAARPQNPRAHNNLGRLLYERGSHGDAIASYRHALRLDATVAQTHFNLGLALLRLGSVDEAVSSFTEAVRILPLYSDAHLNLGIALAQLGRLPEARGHFLDAIRHTSFPAEAHFQAGVALAAQEAWAEAISHFAQAAALDPRHAKARSNWGVALTHLQATADAIAQFQQALRIDPDLAEAHFNLGIALALSDRLAEAVPPFAEAVRLDPANAAAHLNLGTSLARLGRTAEAIEHLRHAVRLRPDDAGARYNLGTALFSAGQLAEAQAELQSTLEIAPEFDAARQMLRRVQEALATANLP